MSAIRERTVLCAIDLPKKLTSHRNLLAHFANFGEVKNVSVNKDLRTALVNFSSHFDAQSAKSQGKFFEGKPLNIFWSDSTILDPRAKEKYGFEAPLNETLWQNDDKECFGVESASSNTRDERKQSAKDMIQEHLKLPSIKKKLSLDSKTGELKKSELLVAQRSPTKLGRVGPKAMVPVKRNILIPGNKRKLIRKEGEMAGSVASKMKKSSIRPEQATVASMMGRSVLKHKLALLDKRDKLIRGQTIQGSDIETAVTIKGTCPDMCPERERILRQCGHAMAMYEMFPGMNEMDENRAVKEYNRSSADQEVPLPHDLRPEPVLSMTMNYLITNIISKIDNPDVNKAVWYSFCWNRLRSIRKDIILQQLCDLETVTIVEQCARFHISCYDHMFGAEVSGFGDKINTQNLIDCLQTLRHMYEDLAKHNVICPNESEFYSYLILLKLKSGDAMWEYQQCSLEVQLSAEVQFAIEAYLAFKNNMYSKYFKLVKRASYITACLMQRYFDIVRTQALKIMLKAYCLPGKNVGLSSSFIVSSLKFDSHKNALRFCESEEVDVKVDCDGNDQDVYVSTSSFLIREKRLPIANAVVGKSNILPVYVPHQVHSSFDEHGRLKNLLPGDEDVGLSTFSDESRYSEEEKSEVNIPEVNIQQPAFKFSLSPTKEHENIFGKSLFSSQVTQDHKQLSKGMLENEITHSSMSSQDSLKGVLNSSNSYEVRSTDSYEMEEDFDREITFENNKMQQELASNNVQHMSMSETSSPTMSLLGFQQPFFVPPNSSMEKPSFSFKNEENKVSTIDQGHYFPAKDAQDIKMSEDMNEENVTFSFSVSKNDSSKLFSKYSIDKFNESDLTNLNESRSGFKFETFRQDSIDHEKEKQIVCDYMDIDTVADMNLPNNQDPIKNPHIKTETKEISEIKKDGHSIEDIETASKPLLLEKLLMRKAEEGRLKMEEMKRDQMEKLRKEVEEQNVLRSLKKDLSERLKAINVRKYARQWKKRVEKLKETRADFPLLVQLSVNNHLSLWGTTNSVPKNSIFQRAKEKRNLTRVISQLLLSGITESCKYIGSNLAEALAKSAAKTMKKSVVTPVYWKLGISVPWTRGSISELSVFNQLMRKWCTQSFYKEANAVLGSVECVITSLEILVNTSVHFSDNLQSTHDLKGMDALVFTILNESESEQMCLHRLRSLVTCQVKRGELSVAVMNIGGSKLERVLKMELEELHEQNLVAHWTFHTWSNPNCIIKSLDFLVERINVVPHICASPLKILVEQIFEEFFDALSSGQHSSEELMDAVKNPNNVIYLYNTCLTKIEDLLISSKLEKYFNLAEEFKMYVPVTELGGPELLCGKHYDNLYKSQISKKISSLKLPELPKWPAKSPNRLVKILKSYCSQIHDISIFSQIIRMLDLPDEHSDLLKHLEQVSWLNIVEIWAQCSIRHTFPTTEKSKLFVIFNKNDVQSLIKKQWWLKLPVVVQFSNC